MTAIVSVMMIALGFIQGHIMTKMIEESHVKKLEQKLEEAVDTVFQKDLEIDELIEELTKEKESKQQLIDQLRCLTNVYSSLPPPEERPLKRSRAYLESDSEQEELDLPISPNVE